MKKETSKALVDIAQKLREAETNMRALNKGDSRIKDSEIQEVMDLADLMMDRAMGRA